MGCGTCGTGKPNGCKSNGGCSTGSCNRMNVYDWLKNLPFADSDGGCKVIEVSFKQGSRKDFFRNVTLQEFEKGELITLEGVSGFDVGEVSLTGEMVRLQMKKKGVSEMNPDMKKVLRRSTDRDIELFRQQKSREPEALMRSRAISRQLNLDMKLSEVEFQADGRKATFFYTADDRVDFRELIKIYAAEFKVKVEMRQIGIRQDAGKVGGIGSCGRELCCATWLTDFKSVTTTAARYQNLSINQTKLSGQCGRLKCCLNYELDTYLDALQGFPNNADTLQTSKGNASLVKKDIFKNLMWYMLPDSGLQYPLTITRVKEIVRLNAKGEFPDDLQPVDLTSNKQKEESSAHVELVGQISLSTLDRNNKKRKDKERDVKNNEKKGEPVPQRRNEPSQQNKAQQQKAEKRPQPQQQRATEGKQQQPKQKAPNNNNNQQQAPKNKPPQQPKRANVNGSNPQQKAPQQPQQKQRPPQQRPQPPQLPPPGEGENI